MVRIAGGARAARHAARCRFEVQDARAASGPCAARAAAQRLWRGEEFYFQIDAHMRWVLARGVGDACRVSLWPATPLEGERHAGPHAHLRI
jgi:hypothetical protein